MLDLLLLFPKDVIRSKITLRLDLISLVRFDAAVTSHEHRQGFLAHVLDGADIAEDVPYTEKTVRWLVSRGVNVAGMNFPANVQDADIEEALLALSQTGAITLNECANISDKCAQNFFDQCASLYSLIIRGCTWLTDDTLRVVADCHPDLEELRINDAPLVTDAGLTCIASHCPLLGIVDLEKCIQVGDPFIRKLGSGLHFLRILDCPQVNEEELLAFIAARGDKLFTFAGLSTALSAFM